MKAVLIPLLFLSLTTSVVSAQQPNQTNSYAETRELLLRMKRAHEYEALKKLFEESATRRSDLVKALYDPEQKVSLNAQTILKYVADAEALASLAEWVAYRRKQTENYWTSPVDIITEQRFLQGNRRELVRQILRSEFGDRKDGWGKLIGYEPKNRIALIEIVFGQTFTEGWHIAVRKENGKWRLLSKSLVWQS